jgi:hypothetical protein
MSQAKLEVRMESLLPFLQGTCTPYNMPVYPGAQRNIAWSIINRLEREARNLGGATGLEPATPPVTVNQKPVTIRN